MNLTLFRLQVSLANKTISAVTGRRDLLDDDRPRLLKRVRKHLNEITDRAGGAERCVLMTGLAPGADELVAEVALTQNIPLYVVLPTREADYRATSFENPAYEPAFARLGELVREARRLSWKLAATIQNI